MRHSFAADKLPARSGTAIAIVVAPAGIAAGSIKGTLMAARPSWEGFVTFNLISIPVKAYNVASSGGGKIGFHMLHKGCNQRIRYKKVCPIHGEVENDDIVSGYEVSKGEYVTVEKEERSELRDEDDKAIAIDTFIAPDAIDPIYFSGRSFYLVPNGPPAKKPYAVLMEAMRGHARHAIARVVFSGRAQIAIVRPLGPVLAMTLLSFEGTVKPPDDFADDVGGASVSAEERKLAAALLESATDQEFELARYKDDYTARLAKLIQTKTKRKVRTEPKHANGAMVEDLMDALRKSLTQERRRPARRASAKKARPARRPKRVARVRG
jgi:DNA end-binding protein Ku